MRIRITSRPEGEAPEWVRDQWIGLALPILDYGIVETTGYGVLSGPKSPLGEFFASLIGRQQNLRGYAVDPTTAVEILSATSPEAAAWWREKAKHMFDGTQEFIFDGPCAEPLP